MWSNIGGTLRFIIILMDWLRMDKSLVSGAIDMIMGLGVSCLMSYSMRVLSVILAHSLLNCALWFLNLVVETLKAWNGI